jgi:heme-degrading monooxygenase HmoA
MTHVRVWKFLPPAGREQEFARAYSSDGPWAELFGRGRGYRGTVLLRPEQAGGWWLTVDRWDSAVDFEAFTHDFGDEYRALDEQLRGVAGEEEFVGAFEERDGAFANP